MMSTAIEKWGVAALVALGFGCDGGLDGDTEERRWPTTIAIPGPKTYPEGITATGDGTFFVTGMRNGDVFRVAPGAAAAEEFIASGTAGLAAGVGLLADEARSTLWVCSANPPGFPISAVEGAGPTALYAFDLASGAHRQTYVFPGSGLCNDVAMDTAGNVYATDTFGGRILVLPAGGDALEVWSRDPLLAGPVYGFGANGIAIDSEDRMYVNVNESGKLLRIPIRGDGEPGQIREIALARPLAGSDGMQLIDDDTILLVENAGGMAPGAVSIIDVMGDRGEITPLASGLTGFPTTVAIHKRRAWVVEGQLDHHPAFGGDDQPAPPFVVSAFDLR
jgi:sugar lactone lactonase YvrE